MNRTITTENLDYLNEYLLDLTDAESDVTGFNTKELILTARELINFWKAYEGKSPSLDYQKLDMALSGSFKNAFINYKDIYRSLIAEYPAAVKRQKIKDLMSMRIGDMTGYQFEELLKQLGLISGY
ncbi:hypothetical protein [Runella sp.]|uniref:hypothetical protein n=1 Tax=Runella sp. TaxID=1960881 RepID=UPI003D14C669